MGRHREICWLVGVLVVVALSARLPGRMDGYSVDGIALGMTRAEVRNVAGAPLETPDPWTWRYVPFLGGDDRLRPGKPDFIWFDRRGRVVVVGGSSLSRGRERLLSFGEPEHVMGRVLGPPDVDVGLIQHYVWGYFYRRGQVQVGIGSFGQYSRPGVRNVILGLKR